MPQPTLSQVHVNRPLTNISRAYIQGATNFVAPMVFPRVPVGFKSDLYFRYKKEDFMRDEMAIRAPATESAGSGYNVDTDNYSCDVWALHKDIDDQIRANYDSPLDAERDASVWLSQQSMIRLERQFASKYFTTGVWATDAVGGTDFIKWDDPSSNPEVDIAAARTVILRNTGMMPNTMVVSHEVHEALKRHPVIKDRFKYTSSDSITEQMLARFFEVDRYLVSRAVYNSANEGAAGVFGFAVGRNVLLCYVNPTPTLMAPSAGYIFTWRGLLGGAGADLGTAIKRFRIEQIGSDRVEIEAAFDMKVVAADCGYFFSGAVDAAT